MKKSLSLLLALVMLFSLAACGGGEEVAESAAPEATEESTAPETAPEGDEGEEESTEAGTYEIALVTDVGNIDDKSFNEGSWNGVVQYAEEMGVSYSYYQPSEDSNEARMESIATAVDKGAKVIVCPGFMFAESLYQAQDLYPDVMFLGIDVNIGDMVSAGGGDPTSADTSEYVKPNVTLVNYMEEQAGYLAGYAAVQDGFTNLGFLGGMAVPAVVRFGYGFVQGVDDASAELGVETTINYWYANLFTPDPSIKVKMDSWFTTGTEVVFACGGGIYLSAVESASQVGASMIGVDVDQSAQSDIIITSAMKGLTASTYLGLKDLYDNGVVWPESYAGQTVVLGAAENAVGLPTAEESWRFATYTVEQYEEVFAKVASGEIEISNAIDMQPEVTTTVVDYQE